MKKYKLIKKYPGSIKLGEIIEVDDSVLLYTNYCLIQGVRTAIPKSYVLQYPEYWEEIIEKDYEILSFQYKNDVSLIRIKNNLGSFDTILNQYLNSKDFTEEYMLAKLNDWNIHSVKRLSDGKIFTVGDNILLPNGNKVKILSILTAGLSNEDIELYYSSVSLVSNRNSNWFNLIQHVKQPLFTTEDGVDIFIGDVYYNVCVKSFTISTRKSPNQYASYEDSINFSTKQAAEEYIINNKPSLSLSEALTFVSQSYGGRLYCQIKDDIIKLIKQKLNL